MKYRFGGGKMTNKYNNAYDEYKEIQHLREIWSGGMGRWNQIFIPLSWAILALFITQLPKFKGENWGLQYLITGWLLLFVFLVFWRRICHLIDRQIVNFYPRCLELEKDLSFEMQSSYFFNNLSSNAKNFLAFQIENMTCEKIQNIDYREFKDLTKEPNELLLKVWDKYKQSSVTNRGHFLIDSLAAGIIIGYGMVIIIGVHLNWWIWWIS